MGGLGQDRAAAMVRVFTYAIVVLAILGPLLPGPVVFGQSLFPYRLFLPFYMAAIGWTILKHPNPQFELPKAFLLVVSLVCLAIVSVLWAPNQYAAIQSIGRLLTGVALTTGVILTIRSRTALHRLYLVLTVLAVVAIGVSAVEIVFEIHLPTSKVLELPDREPYNSYATAWFYNPNDLAFFFILATGYPLTLAALSDYRPSSRVLLGSLWLGGVVIAVSNSARAALIASTIQLVAIIGFTLSRRGGVKANQIHLSRIPVPAAVAGVLIATLVLITIPNPVPPTNGSLFLRWQLQSAAADIGVSTLTGVGVGNAPQQIINSGQVAKDVGDPHSWYGVVLAELGIAGAVLVTVLFGKLISSSARAAGGSFDPRLIPGAAWAIALPAAALGPSNAFDLNVFWVGVGTVLATVLVREQRKSTPHRTEGSNPD